MVGRQMTKRFLLVFILEFVWWELQGRKTSQERLEAQLFNLVSTALYVWTLTWPQGLDRPLKTPSNPLPDWLIKTCCFLHWRHWDVYYLLESMISQTDFKVTGKNMTIRPEKSFLLISSLANFPIRDLHMINDLDKDDSFHLDSVKEP